MTCGCARISKASACWRHKNRRKRRNTSPTRSGKPWGKVAQYEAARRVLADAGLDADGGGSFRLRHSFALRQLQHGHDAGLVAGWLGVVDPQVMLRYQQALAGQPLATTAAPAGGQPAPWPV